MVLKVKILSILFYDKILSIFFYNKILPILVCIKLTEGDPEVEVAALRMALCSKDLNVLYFSFQFNLIVLAFGFQFNLIVLYREVCKKKKALYTRPVH